MEDLRDIFNNPYNQEVASLKGRVFRAGYRAELSNGDHYFVQIPEAGTKLKYINFSGSVLGNLEIDLIYGDVGAVTVGSTLDTIVGYCTDNTLSKVSNNDILKVSSITGGVNLPIAVAKTATSQSQRTSSTLAEANIRSVYDSNRPVYLKINASSNTEVNLLFIWEEV